MDILYHTFQRQLNREQVVVFPFQQVLILHFVILLKRQQNQMVYVTLVDKFVLEVPKVVGEIC